MLEWLEIAVALLALQPISGQDDGFSSQMTHWLWRYSWHVTSDSEVTFVIICSFVSYSWLWASWPNIYNSLTTNSIYTEQQQNSQLDSWCLQLLCTLGVVAQGTLVTLSDGDIWASPQTATQTSWDWRLWLLANNLQLEPVLWCLPPAVTISIASILISMLCLLQWNKRHGGSRI